MSLACSHACHTQNNSEDETKLLLRFRIAPRLPLSLHFAEIPKVDSGFLSSLQKQKGNLESEHDLLQSLIILHVSISVPVDLRDLFEWTLI